MTAEPPRAGLRDDTRGAVYVEFLIAFLPVFVFFLCLLQLALLFSAKLLVEHAATEGSRAAAVVFGDDARSYDEPGGGGQNTLSKARADTVRAAVLIALAPLILDDTVASVGVAYPEARGGNARLAGSPIAERSGNGMIRVQVTATVVCKIALANMIACEAFGNSTLRVRNVPAESVFPYQGADYVYE
jgi:hypothetical protein